MPGFTSADKRGSDISSPATKSTSGIPSSLLTYFMECRECASLAGDSSATALRARVVPSQCEPRTRCSSAEEHRSEEHTSELQSQSNLVCRLLLEKKKKHETLVRHVHH